MALSYLIVRTRGRLYALPVTQVVETLRLPALEKGSSDVKGWLGTTMLRGELVAAFELGALLGFADAALLPGSAPTRAVAVRLGDGPQVHYALLAVDELIGVKLLENEQLQQIALPGGGEMPIGRFDAGFARLIDVCGVLREMPSPGGAGAHDERAAT